MVIVLLVIVLLFHVFMSTLSPSQIPKVITVSAGVHHSWLPVEVAGHFIRRFGLDNTPELLVSSTSPHLAIALCVRGPIAVNVTWGHPQFTHADLDQLQQYLDEWKSVIKVHAEVPGIQWSLSSV